MQKRFTLGKCLTFFDLFFRQEERVFASYFGHAGYFDNGYVSAKITTSRLWRGSADLQRNTELLMFFCICFIVCLHKSCDYISIGEITNMNHKCISLSKLSFGYQFFFVALWGSILSIMRRSIRSFNIPSLGYLNLWGLTRSNSRPLLPGQNYIQIPLLILKVSLCDQRML